MTIELQRNTTDSFPPPCEATSNPVGAGSLLGSRLPTEVGAGHFANPTSQVPRPSGIVPSLPREPEPAPVAVAPTLQDPALKHAEEIEAVIAEASRCSDAGEVGAAEVAYRQADDLLGSERSPRHAEVLVCLAMLLRRKGQIAQASSYLDTALSIFPEHRAALCQRLDLARELGDRATAAAIRGRMVTFCESEEARVHVLTEVVDEAVAAAIAAVREAIEIRPGDSELRLRLGALLDAT